MPIGLIVYRCLAWLRRPGKPRTWSGMKPVLGYALAFDWFLFGLALFAAQAQIQRSASV
jgi:hypothetical protein